MKVSTAALPFLVLAAALGLPTHATFRHRSPTPDARHASDCCFSYATRNIRCIFMQNYYETSSKCSQPAVIFKTRGGQEVCFHPSAEGVQECITKLASANTKKTAGEEKLY